MTTPAVTPTGPAPRRQPLGANLSIRTRVVASTLVVLLLLIALFVSYFPARQQQVAEADLRDRTREMAEMVGTGVGVGLELNQLPTVLTVVNWAKRNKSLAYLVVLDPDGQTIGSFNPGGIPLDQMRIDRPNEVVQTRDLVKVTSPVTYQDRQLGTVYLGLSLEGTHQEANRFRLTVLLLAVVALGLGAAIALMLAGRITEPIRRLRRAADQVAAGDYQVEIDHSGGDEVARLGQAFAIMVGRIRNNLTDLETYSASLAEARDNALAGARAKADFLAAMSHEIRTPMNGVLGMLALLEETTLSAKQGGFVKTASRSAHALLTVIDDILDFSKIDAGRMELEHVDFDLRSTIEDVAQLLAEQAHGKRLDLTCVIDADVPEWVNGDTVRVRQILFNLGGNAVKFTMNGQVRIKVSLQTADTGTAGVRFEIADSGIGMSAAVQARLFQPFVQADSSTTRRFGGTGLGLSICRRLVLMMGGTIGVESTEGVGSTFWFQLPLPRAAAPADTPGSIDLTGLGVMVVDDHPTNQEILDQYLTARGAKVLVAGSGRQARTLLERAVVEGLPAVAIIDAAMPGEDGLALGLALRTDPRFAGMRQILLTSIGGRAEVAAAASAFDGYLTKPVRLGDLLQTVATVTGRARRPVQAVDPAANEAPRGVRILLAEDHEINQMLATEILERAGYLVDVVPNGHLAVEARFQRDYRLILMDCQMPVMDGFEAARAIRKREANRTRTVPIVALTANAIEGDREACLAAGMDDYLSKPFTTTGLLTMIAKWIASTPPAEPAPKGPRLVAPAPESTAPIELAHLTDLAGSDPAKIRRYLDMFSQLTEPALASLAGAIGSGDREQVRKLAHKVKGSCAMVGAKPMAAVAAQIEHDANTGELDGLSLLVDDLHHRFESARTFAANYDGAVT